MSFARLMQRTEFRHFQYVDRWQECIAIFKSIRGSSDLGAKLRKKVVRSLCHREG